MAVIGSVKQVSTQCVFDNTQPENVTVKQAHWGDFREGACDSGSGCDLLILTLSGLEPGATLLFVNTDDPNVREVAKTQSWDKLPRGAVKEYRLPEREMAGDQVLRFSSKLADELGLTTGCEFMVTQRDRACNVSEKPGQFDVRPPNVTVSDARWGELRGGRDPLILTVSGLQPGATLLFVNTDDPKVRHFASTRSWDKLPEGMVKEYPLPKGDLSDKQVVSFSDNLAKELGLTVGCEFMVTQRDCARNVAKKPAHVKLGSKGVTRYQTPEGARIGDVELPPRRIPQFGGDNFVEFHGAKDETPASIYANDIELALDACSKKARLTGKQAVTGESTVRLKNLATGWQGSVKSDEEGSFSTEVGLRPGDPYSLDVTDRNGVYQDIVSLAYFEPQCGKGNDESGGSSSPATGV